MSDTTTDAAATGPVTNPIVSEAHKRYDACRQWETTARDRWLKDVKFDAGDEYNGYQWPDGLIAVRGQRPSLTVNETQQHNNHIINEALQNKAQVRYRPTGGGASVAAATAMEGIYRHIENISNAQMAQGVAIGFQVRGGLGYTIIRSRFITDDPAEGEDPFEQDIYIEGCADPLSVYIDCDARELDGSDARYAFIFADKPRDEVEKQYPQLKGRGSPQNAVDGSDSIVSQWITEKHIRVAEYYVVNETADEIMTGPDGTSGLRSKLTPEIIKAWEAAAEEAGTMIKKRRVVTKKVQCHTIVGDEVVDTTDIPGRSIPIVPWVGTVTVLDGQLDRKGHTRTMIGPQRMLNYNWSGAIESGALQTKTPWVGPMKAFEEFQGYWDRANTQNLAWLPYNHIDDQGNPIPPPTRTAPPQSTPAYMDQIAVARQFMHTASGQYETEMGAPGNERSGKAINERQRLGQRATYHFIDHQALAIRRQGQIIMEWIPEIYDTQRVLRILGEDGDEDFVQIDPKAAVAHQAVDMEGISGILNPSIGRYEVISDVGPDYATQRQEAFQAMVDILSAYPALMDRMGDLFMKMSDFPMADQIAERLKPNMSPAAFEALQEQLAKAVKAGANSEKLLKEAMQALAEERLKAKNYDAENAVKGIEADTKRLAVVKDMLVADPMFPALLREIIMQNMQDDLGPIQAHLMQEVTRPAVEDTEPAEGPAPTSMAAMLPMNVPNPGEAAATPGGV